MKIIVTGHTTGIGKHIFDFYQIQGCNVTGFSRSNGFDLRDWAKMQHILDLVDQYDIVFSNAKPDFFQTVFLYEFARRQNFNTKIVSIGSQIIKFDIDPAINIGINLYKTQKLALQNAHQQLTVKFPDLKSILIHPGHLYDNDGTLYADLDTWVQKLHQVTIDNNSIELDVI